MSLIDVLKQYAGNAAPTADTGDHYDEVARATPPDVLGRGISAAMRSDQTPPFGDMVSQLFGRSNAQQQAGVLNQLLRALGPGALSSLASGVLGRVLGPNAAASGSSPPVVTPDQASQVSADQVRDIAAQAEQHNPGIVDQVGGFYGQHPELVKGLGAMALAVLLGKLAHH